MPFAGLCSSGRPFVQTTAARINVCSTFMTLKLLQPVGTQAQDKAPNPHESSMRYKYGQNLTKSCQLMLRLVEPARTVVA